jgi:hypothetical protein
MLSEQVLHHAVVRKAEHDRLMGPPSAVWWSEPDEAGESEPSQGPEAASAPAPAEPDPPGAKPEPIAAGEESDAAFGARATAMFNATLSQAPPGIRELLATFSQEELSALIGGVWPDEAPDEHGEAQPQGP